MGNVPIKEFVMILQECVNVTRVLKGVHAKVIICFCCLPCKFWIIKYDSQIGLALVETYHAVEMDNVTWQWGCAIAMLDIKDWIAQVGFDWFAFIGQKQGMQIAKPNLITILVWLGILIDTNMLIFVHWCNLHCINPFASVCASEQDTSSACYCGLF